MPEPTYQPGDLVTLKSGGVAMTVHSYHNEDMVYVCFSTQREGFRQILLPVALLMPYVPRETVN